MTHTVTSKLNKDARQHPNASGVTFFVSLGEQNYNFKTKAKEWTNYDAALFAKDGQIAFYQQVLVAGAIISVSGTGIIMVKQDGYDPKLELQDAKLVGNWDCQQVAPQAQAAPMQQPQPQQAPQQNYQSHPQQAQPMQRPVQQGGFVPVNQPQAQQPNEQPMYDQFGNVVG